MAWSPHGTLVATGGGDGRLKLWDSRTGRLLRTIEVRENGEVQSIAFAPDGKTIATGCTDQEIDFWNVANGDKERQFVGHGGWRTALAIAPDGKMLACEDVDDSGSTIQLWDMETGTVRQTLPNLPGVHRNDLITLAFSPDGTRLAGGGWSQDVKMWNTQTGALLKTFDKMGQVVWSVAFSPEGKRLVTTSNEVRVWDAQTGATLSSLEPSGGRCARFSTDGKFIVSAHSSADGDSIKLWDAQTGTLVRSWGNHSGYMFSLAFSPDGGMLVTGHDDTTAKLWDVQTGQEEHKLGVIMPICAIALASDGITLVSSNESTLACLWNLQTGGLTRTLAHPASVLAVAGNGSGIVVSAL